MVAVTPPRPDRRPADRPHGQRDARRHERGSVLLFTVVAGLLAMGVWLLAWRATHDAIRVEKFNVGREVRRESVLEGLNQAVALLRTGRPPSDPYQAVVSVSGASTTYDCTVTYTSDIDQDHWIVEVDPATDEETGSLPALPSSFDT